MKNVNRRQSGFLIWLLLALITGCDSPPNGQAPTPEPVLIHDLDIASGQTIFVPAYSEMYYASNGRTLELAVTLAVHNTDFTNAIILTSARYYNGDGLVVQEYLPQPLTLGPLASTEFFVETRPESGGVGTNFVVEWVAEQPVYEPIVEAIMLSTTSSQGISFTSPGRVIRQISPEPEQAP
jgi:hypothetical protein